MISGASLRHPNYESFQLRLDLRRVVYSRCLEPSNFAGDQQVLPNLGEGACSGSLNRSLEGSFAFRIRFSAVNFAGEALGSPCPTCTPARGLTLECR
jgi:hypothetical protein